MMWVNLTDEAAQVHFGMTLTQWKEYKAALPRYLGKERCPQCGSTEVLNMDGMFFFGWRCRECDAEWDDTCVAVDRKIMKEGKRNMSLAKVTGLLAAREGGNKG